MIKEVEHKIKGYFTDLPNYGGLTQEMLIPLYFQEFSDRNGVDFDYIFEKDPQYSIPDVKKKEKGWITEENKFFHFAHLKVKIFL